MLFTPRSGVKVLPGLPVQKLPAIIASGSKSEYKKAPQRLLPLAPTKNSLRDSIQLRMINVSHYAVDEKTDGHL